MFDSFAANFPVDPPDATREQWREGRLLGADGYEAFADRFAGRSFSQGLYSPRP